jgi:hypothetical protein
VFWSSGNPNKQPLYKPDLLQEDVSFAHQGEGGLLYKYAEKAIISFLNELSDTNNENQVNLNRVFSF